MSNIEYQKIELHSTNNLGKDFEQIEYEREVVQRLMMENQIKFTIEIDEVDIKNSSNSKIGTDYVLNLIVRKDNVEKVIELLDREGGLGYFIDLDETFDPMSEENEEEEQEGPFREITKKLKVEESESVDEDPIRNYGENNEKVTIEHKPIGMNNLTNLIMKVIFILAFSIIYLMEIGLMIFFWIGNDYENVTGIVVAMIIETPIFVWFYKIFN